MIIGIDLDGVLFDSENYWRAAAELFDIQIRGRGIVERNEIKCQSRYDWPAESYREFIRLYAYEITMTAPLKPCAAEVIKKLQEEGHTLIAITARGSLIEGERDWTLERLAQEGIKLDGIFFDSHDKLPVCKAEKVDYMIEDSVDNIAVLQASGVKCIYFRELSYKPCAADQEVSNWGEVYRLLH